MMCRGIPIPHWQEGPTTIPTFGSRLYGLLRFRPLLRILRLFINRERHQQSLQ
nr:hypothetical protein I308_05418 [Cryptococcus tetragattii IND107]